MRLREVVRYELRYRLRSPATWVYAAFLFLVGYVGVLTAGGGGDAVRADAPQQIAHGTVLFGGLFGLLISAALFADAAIRDVAVGMDPLLYTTRLRRGEYLGGQFLATLAVNALLVLAIPLGHAVHTVTAGAPASASLLLAAYAQPLLLFLLPNLVLVGAILFAIGTLARQVIPVYLGAAGIFIGYLVAANYWSAIESPVFSALADPLGINALLAMTRYWTPAERNVRLIGFPAALVANRVLWLAIASGVLALLHRRFRFAHADASGRRRAGGLTGAESPAPVRWTGAVPPIAGIFGARTRVRQTLAVARESLVEVASGRVFPVALVAAVGLVLLWGWNVVDTLFDTSTWPVTYLVAAVVLSQRAIVIPWLVIALYSGELVWKDRDVGAAEIADAAPLPTGVALLGRFLALVAIVVVFQVAFLVGGLLLQTLHGYRHFELGVYARILFGVDLVDYVLLGALAMAVHVLVNQKYVGYLLVLPACALRLAARSLGIPDLAAYGGGPRWLYSDMNGFGPFLRPLVWFKLYWAAWALLLGVVAALFWVRGREPGVRRRIVLARARLRGPTAWLGAAAAALALALGGVVLYNTRVLNPDPAPDAAGRSQAAYERRYRRFLDAPQPQLTAASLRLELYPNAPAADVRGVYRLVNRTGVTIDSVHVTLDADVAVRSMTLDRTARLVVADDEAGYRIFALERALAPGDSLRLSFAVSFRPRGFRSSEIPTAVVGNGSDFDRRWLPFIGYQPVFELSGADRATAGLAARPRMPAPSDAEARRRGSVMRNEDGVQVEAVVGTAVDQTVVMPGTLRRSWIDSSAGSARRRYFQYGTDAPIGFANAVFSARYAVAEDRWEPPNGVGQGVGLQVFHHPGHRYDVDGMLRAMKASLDYYTGTFGPYPFRQLRIAEVPPYGVKGHSDPSMITFAEDFFLTRADAGGFDQTFFGTAHETAHQWWGAQLGGAYARGLAFLSESMANYSAMLVTERTFGPAAVRRVYDYQMDRYLQRRADFPSDVPLLEVESHPHVAYGKGAVAMWTLRELVGEDAVDAALRRFLARHRGGGPPYATSLDLYAELRAATPDSLHSVLTDLFETVTLWSVKAERASVRPTGTGAYEVTLDVVARKVRADSVGHEAETPMNDLVEIGVFETDTDDRAPLYLQRRRIHGGRQTLRIVVPRKPARAGVDPYHKLIGRDRDDDVVAVTSAPQRRPEPTR